MTMTSRYTFPLIFAAASAIAMLPSCQDGKSYSELLNEEEKAVNWYMSNQKIELTIPADSVFLTGEDAPYYKMDEQGYVYMQVLDPGNPDDRAQKGDQVYFRFMCRNLNYLYQGLDSEWIGNGDNLGAANTSFIFDDMYMVTSMTYGQGLQWPLRYLGYNCEVNLVIRSYYGLQDSQSQCLAYVYKVKYYKAEY